MKALNRRAVLAGAAALPALALPVSALAQDTVSEKELLVAGPLGDKVLGDDNAPVNLQHPIAPELEKPPENPPQSRAVDADRLARLETRLKPLDEPLAQSLKALGRNVLARS